MEPFLKWAGGKRWFSAAFPVELSEIAGRYIEPFLGGGAIFFKFLPARSVLSDANPRLIECYLAIRGNPQEVSDRLRWYQKKHSKEFYYAERSKRRRTAITRAAQFLYLNRTCWNGLYRENKLGQFNVPIGTKTLIFDGSEDFQIIGQALKSAELQCCDFEASIDSAREGDVIFADPPYTVAHNMNGFVKYNQEIFNWGDQLRLRDALSAASERGAKVILTQAAHESIVNLYSAIAAPRELSRNSKISGHVAGRRKTKEALYVF